MGWSMGSRLVTALMLDALDMALRPSRGWRTARLPPALKARGAHRASSTGPEPGDLAQFMGLTPQK
ncbi:MAG: hypothetical protein OXJ56_20255 [Rhodospirillaceae bacterium]|nr:hypothetical protein [Rhodospirillaceae bacterium]